MLLLLVLLLALLSVLEMLFRIVNLSVLRCCCDPYCNIHDADDSGAATGVTVIVIIVNRHVDTQLSYMAVGFQSRDQHTRTLRSDTDGFDPNRD